jgi:very-short-patch-repair endonuclease
MQIANAFTAGQARQMERMASSKQGTKDSFRSAAHRMYLESQIPPSGRGWAGPLPLDPVMVFPAGEGPFMGGFQSKPVNAAAVYERVQHIRTGHRFDDGGQRFSVNPYQEAQLREMLAEVKSDEELFELAKTLPMPDWKQSYASKADQQRQIHRGFTTWEQELYKIVNTANLPIPFYAQYTAGPQDRYQLDGAFPSIKLGLEADSHTYHATPEAIAKDRRRDQELAMQGWHILRFKEEELKGKKQEVIQVILATIRKLMQQG